MLLIQFHALGDTLIEDALYSPEDVLAEEYIRTLTISLFQHFLPIALACMVSAALYAYAYLKNKKVHETHAVAEEALRRQRWQIANLSLVGLLGASLPTVFLFITNSVDARIWIAIAVAYIPLLWAVWRYAKIIRLSKRSR